MKAKERHRLKTNELAQSLSELPEYLRKHGSRILTVGMVVLVVLAGGLWWWGARAEAGQERMLRLNELLGRGEAIQMQAIQQARLEAKPGQEQLSDGSYSAQAEALASSFGALSAEAGSTTVGVTALLQQAQALRSEMLYSDQSMSRQEKEQLSQEVTRLYQCVCDEYPSANRAVGTARLGLALVAEDQQQWKKARELYRQIVADKEGSLAGTIYPAQAERRLKVLEDLPQNIEFPIAAMEEEADIASVEKGPSSEDESMTESTTRVEEESSLSPDKNQPDVPAQAGEAGKETNKEGDS